MLIRMLDGSLKTPNDADFDPSQVEPSQFDKSLEDPLSVLVPFLRENPKWVIMGGLGDVDEIGPARKRWPNARFVGIDPDHRALLWQIEHGWGNEHFKTLLRLALSDKSGSAKMNLSTICCASLHSENLAAAKKEEIVDVETTTLDRVDRLHGPFDNSVLWLDGEGYDYKALLGGRNLLESGRVLLIGIEVWYRLETKSNQDMYALLSTCGYERCMTWFRQWWGHNEVWRRKIGA